MSVMLLFTAMSHFMFTDGMSMMISDFSPLKKEIVYSTGVIEIIGAISLHNSKFRTVTAWLLILFFILILLANIKAFMEQIDYQSVTFEGNGLVYLWFRVPFQIFFILWVYFSSIMIY
ncbi:hypothetical protein KCTC52924_03083 [Arenibacter antarcticus]